jgi:CheY-like chemotaxis protein
VPHVLVPPTASASTKLSILVIDDGQDTAETMECLLKLVGHEAQIALNRHQAIELARRQHPDYVLLDLGLPGLDGYQVASRLRQERADPLVIIAVTCYGQEVDRQRFREAGINHHLIKPPDLTALLSLLSTSRAVSG